ncbi:MAG: hypothetical protein K2K53_07370, partial [Oscillospiraceae bacterium]|nr:hypothetical protein [Oscillospiraceae bacterium]
NNILTFGSVLEIRTRPAHFGSVLHFYNFPKNNGPILHYRHIFSVWPVFYRIIEIGEQTGPFQEIFKNLLKMVPLCPRFFFY